MTEPGLATWRQWIGQGAIVTFIVAQVCFAAIGLETMLGYGLGPAVVMLSLILRFGITFVIGAYLCAYITWGWPLFAAALFSVPALILLFPHLLADAFRLCAGARAIGR